MTPETGGNYKTRRARWGTVPTQYYNHIQELMIRYVETKSLTSTFLPGYETKREEDSILIFDLLALVVCFFHSVNVSLFLNVVVGVLLWSLW